MQAIELKTYDIFRTKFGEKEAETVMEYFESKTEKKAKEITHDLEESQKQLASKEDLANTKVEILRQIYIINIIQLLAIIGSVLAIVKFVR